MLGTLYLFCWMLSSASDRSSLVLMLQRQDRLKTLTRSWYFQKLKINLNLISYPSLHSSLSVFLCLRTSCKIYWNCASEVNLSMEPLVYATNFSSKIHRNRTFTCKSNYFEWRVKNFSNSSKLGQDSNYPSKVAAAWLKQTNKIADD